MPEMHFTISWPDGGEMRCYSPSLVIEEHLSPGTAYPLAEFLARSRAALRLASQRVEQIHGFPCGRALGQLAKIEGRAAEFAATTDAGVRVLAFQRI